MGNRGSKERGKELNTEEGGRGRGNWQDTSDLSRKWEERALTGLTGGGR